MCSVPGPSPIPPLAPCPLPLCPPLTPLRAPDVCLAPAPLCMQLLSSYVCRCCASNYAVSCAPLYAAAERVCALRPFPPVGPPSAGQGRGGRGTSNGNDTTPLELRARVSPALTKRNAGTTQWESNLGQATGSSEGIHPATSPGLRSLALRALLPELGPQGT